MGYIVHMKHVIEIPTIVVALGEILTSHGFETRVVGGAVRDSLLFTAPKDWDLATTATPDQMLEIAHVEGISVYPTGYEYGTITFVYEGYTIEVTTLRNDISTDGRRAEVQYTSSFFDDSARRDLTINSMYALLDGTVVDYHGGIEDLERKWVSFVGDPSTRMCEDYLRIMRMFRFAARLDFTIDGDAYFAACENIEGLKQVSKERIWTEFKSLFETSKSREALADILCLMNNSGILKVLGFPHINTEVFVPENLTHVWQFLSVVFEDDRELCEFCRRWKMSKDEQRNASWVATNIDEFQHETHNGRVELIRDYIQDGVDRSYISDLIAVTEQDAGHKVSLYWMMNTTYPKRMPINGDDLATLGVPQGKEMGRLLNILLEKWKESRYTTTKEALYEYAKENL